MHNTIAACCVATRLNVRTIVPATRPENCNRHQDRQNAYTQAQVTELRTRVALVLCRRKRCQRMPPGAAAPSRRARTTQRRITLPTVHGALLDGKHDDYRRQNGVRERCAGLAVSARSGRRRIALRLRNRRGAGTMCVRQSTRMMLCASACAARGGPCGRDSLRHTKAQLLGNACSPRSQGASACKTCANAVAERSAPFTPAAHSGCQPICSG